MFIMLVVKISVSVHLVFLVFIVLVARILVHV